MTETASLLTPPAAQPTAATPAVFTERDEFDLALRKAKVYASSSLVPQQYVGSIANCLIALNMARRIGADELMVMQNLHVVQGKPGWSGQFLIATFNKCGRFSAMRFEQRGSADDKKNWGYRAWAVERATAERVEGPWVTWAMVEGEGWNKRSGSKWLTIPDLMFHYRAGAFLVRTHAPEIAMGLPTVEELRDVIDLDSDQFHSSKTEALTAALRNRAAVNVTTGELEGANVEAKRAEPIPATYAEVANLLQRATTADLVEIAADLIRAVPDAAQAKELHALADERRQQFAG